MINPTMASILSSQGVVLVTAMAVSGTVILLALRRQRSQFAFNPISQNPHRLPRPCISSGSKNQERRRRKKKKVHFAEDVVDPSGNGKEFRKKKAVVAGGGDYERSKIRGDAGGGGGKVRGMPANQAALYSGMLRDRGAHRLACAY